MGGFPNDNQLNIHFAHSAYNLATQFAAQKPDIAHFQTWTADETRARIGEGNVLVLSGFWNNDMLPNASSLRYIHACAVGYDQFDQDAIAARGIRLANTAGVNANAVSDHAMALLLGLTRQLHTARDNQRAKNWRGMISDLAAREDELPGKTLLVYGVGRIGRRIASLARAFGMTTLGVKRDVSTPMPEIDELHTPADFVSLLPRADVVVLSCPLTDETRGLVNGQAFAAMRPSSYLINVARGGCVVTEDLIDALDSRAIAGAGIDVTDPEPLQVDSPLWSMDNVILTPHTAARHGSTKATSSKL